MQEEIENRTVNLAISTTKLTARGIIRLAAKGLAYIKRKSREAALKKGNERGDTGFFGSENLKVQAEEGKKVQVTYDLDTFSVYGGFRSHLKVQEAVKVIDPVSWIRKVKSASESIKGE